ncbi:hypothetical protein GQ54DRAFT_30080 [Martensiomyces pterosporus]|nr:hypothetical protein GQ54DRAFT_30080 [Martensiomyces pterosporus]
MFIHLQSSVIYILTSAKAYRVIVVAAFECTIRCGRGVCLGATIAGGEWVRESKEDGMCGRCGVRVRGECPRLQLVSVGIEGPQDYRADNMFGPSHAWLEGCVATQLNNWAVFAVAFRTRQCAQQHSPCTHLAVGVVGVRQGTGLQSVGSIENTHYTPQSCKSSIRWKGVGREGPANARACRLSPALVGSHAHIQNAMNWNSSEKHIDWRQSKSRGVWHLPLPIILNHKARLRSIHTPWPKVKQASRQLLRLDKRWNAGHHPMSHSSRDMHEWINKGVSSGR